MVTEQQGVIIFIVCFVMFIAVMMVGVALLRCFEVNLTRTIKKYIMKLLCCKKKIKYEIDDDALRPQEEDEYTDYKDTGPITSPYYKADELSEVNLK